MKTGYQPYKNIICIILTLLVFISCEKEDISKQDETIRTIIVYMAADNNLSADAVNDIEEMKQGFSGNNVNLLVFLDSNDKLPQLLKINKHKKEVIKSYPELISSDPVVLNTILNEVISMYPANEYGLILWSHGTSWLPAGIGLRSFGEDHGIQMNLSDLATALPLHFNFILFDACLMGSVEVAYELKDKTDYIIASSTETIYNGFPYDEIVPELVAPALNLPKISQKYYDYYNSLQGAYRSATITLIDTKQLSRLAYEIKEIINNNEFK